MAKKRTIVPFYNKQIQGLEALAGKLTRANKMDDAKKIYDKARELLSMRRLMHTHIKGGVQPLSKFHPQHPETNTRGVMLNEVYSSRQKFA